MPTRFRRTMRKLQPYLDRLEPVTIFITYLAVAWSAYFAWFSPPSSARHSMGPEELTVQAIMFSVAAVCCLYGHISDKIFVEEIGLIFVFFASILYIWNLTVFSIQTDSFWKNGELFGIIVIALSLLANRALRIQVILSSKWLKPNVDTLFNEAKI